MPCMSTTSNLEITEEACIGGGYRALVFVAASARQHSHSCTVVLLA